MTIIRIPNALNTLRPNAKYNLIGHEYAGLDWMDAEQTKPTESEINAEVLRLQKDYDLKLYQRLRKYPPIGDQLDALWKGGAAAEEMRATVMAVKTKYPKEVA
jgi:hypothetical protein